MTMLLCENYMEPNHLRRWHACVTLLDGFGHQVDGSIYEGVVCHCEGCELHRSYREELSEEA